MMKEIARNDPAIVLWWGTEVECVSTLSRKLREGNIDKETFDFATNLLSVLLDSRAEILPSNKVRLRAEFLLVKHPLKAADSLQLAAALHWCDGYPVGKHFVSLDKKLRRAAKDRGFGLLPEVRPGEASQPEE